MDRMDPLTIKLPGCETFIIVTDSVSTRSSGNYHTTKTMTIYSVTLELSDQSDQDH